MRFPLAICLARSKVLFEKLGGASITNHFLLILQKLARIGKNLKCYLYLCSKKRSQKIIRMETKADKLVLYKDDEGKNSDS